MTDDNQYNLAMAMKFFGRAIGFASALFLMIMLIGGALMDVLKADGILLAVIGVVALAGCILSFWRERLAIALLLLAAAGLGVYIGVYASYNQLITWLVLGLPYLAAAALLFFSRWLERRD